MTNGEKIKDIFPNMKCEVKNNTVLTNIDNGMWFSLDWWNAKYKEPTTTTDYHRAFKIACDLLNGDILYGIDTDKIYELMMQKDGVVSNSSYEEYILNHLQELDQGQYLTENCIACKYDEIEESDGEHCKKCLEGDNQFELDKEFVESTTKNDLGVDCISRQAVLNLFNKSDEYSWEMSLLKRNIEEMPSVTPQLSSELEKNSKKLEKDFGESDCISRKAVIDELKRYFHDEYYQRTSIQDCRDCFIEDVLDHLPSVTPQPRKGKWMKTSKAVMGEGYMWYCDKCNHEVYQDSSRSYPSENFCPNCGSDNREVEEE